MAIANVIGIHPPAAAKRRPEDDATLMRASIDGDETAFRELFDRHAGAIRSYLFARLGSDAVDDVLIETFTTAWSLRGRFDVITNSARPWLYGIATNLARRHRRDERRWQRAMQAERQIAGAEREQSLQVRTIGPEFAAALATLSRGEREVLLLVALGDLTSADAARSLDIGEPAARKRLQRARARMQVELNLESKGAGHADGT